MDASDINGDLQYIQLNSRQFIWKHRVQRMSNGTLVWLDRDANEHSSRRGLEAGSSLRSALLADPEMLNTSADMLNSAENSSVSECGDCYGAGEEGECCNTCDDVERAHERSKKMVQHHLYHQCAGMDDHLIQDVEGEGCNIYAKVAVSRAGGNLHIQPGKKAVFHSKGQTPQQIMKAMSMRTHKRTWNVSHSIHSLRFGPEYPGAVYQLNGESRKDFSSYEGSNGETRHIIYQYYFQLIPTTFQFLNGTQLETFQYSVTEHVKGSAVSDKTRQLKRQQPLGQGRQVLGLQQQKLQENELSLHDKNEMNFEDDLKMLESGADGPPAGVFFFYEISPLHVTIQESYRKGWISFFTSLCAIIGGVVTLMGMLDQLWFRMNRCGRGGLVQ